jgi:hypothetical protein
MATDYVLWLVPREHKTKSAMWKTLRNNELTATKFGRFHCMKLHDRLAP